MHKITQLSNFLNLYNNLQIMIFVEKTIILVIKSSFPPFWDT